MKLTTQQIVKQLGISKFIVLKRFRDLGIKGIRNGKYFYYSDAQIDQIKTVSKFKKPLFSNPRTNNIQDQFLIIQYLNKGFTNKEIAYFVRVPIQKVINVVTSYTRNDNFLIVQSKMNY